MKEEFIAIYTSSSTTQITKHSAMKTSSCAVPLEGFTEDLCAKN